MANCIKHPDVELESWHGLLQPCPVCVLELEQQQQQQQRSESVEFICLKGGCGFQCFDCMRHELSYTSNV